MKIIKSFLMTVSMYTIIKTPRMNIETKDIPYVFCFFPLIGVIIASVFHFVFPYLLQFHEIFIAGIFAFFPIILTGGIHLDGFGDTCDGYFSYADKEKKLEILKDPHMGAFGAIGITSYLLLNVVIWVQLISAPKYLHFAICGYIISRCLLALFAVCVKPAKGSGLLYMFVDGAGKTAVKITSSLILILIFIILTLKNPFIFSINLLVILIFCLWYYKMINREFGGITGDLAGCLLMCIEFLLILTNAILGVLV